MSSKGKESEQRVKFYTSSEVVRYLSKNGVPKSRHALKELIAIGTTGSVDGKVSQKLIDGLGYVYFEVHPQQINVRDKANWKLITSIRR